MPIKVDYFDKLYETYSADGVTREYAESAKDKLKRWEQERINLNDSSQGFDTFDLNLGYEANSTGIRT